MRHTTHRILALLLTPLAPSFSNAAMPQKPTEVNPVEVGSTVPDVQLTTADGHAVSLRQIVSEQPTVIIFYRGSWCPYCSKHLAALGTIEGTLLEKGYRILALSADSVEKVREAADAAEYPYTLYSDATMEAATAFGLSYEVDAPTLEKLASYKIDLEAASGQKHHLLPVPAVYIVGTDGRITFRYYNPDYSQRLAPEAILKAIE